MNSTDDLFDTIARLYRLGLLVLAMPVILADYFALSTGADYDVGLPQKLLLVARMIRNNVRIPTGSTFIEHLVIASHVLSVPADVEGCLVECGCYKGGSTANLSLVASLCGRELRVFDSFEGMPAPADHDRAHVLVESRQIHTYEENSWHAPLDEVRTNVDRYGDLSVCEFEVGYFDESMSAFDDDCVLVFLDVGLRDSAETALEHLWPRLVDGGYCFTHDVKHMEISTLFFDADWWRDTLDREPPGLVGAGNGLGLHPDSDGFTSLLGYIVKNPDGAAFERVVEDGTGENVVNTSVEPERSRNPVESD